MVGIYSKIALCVGSTSSKSGDAGHFYIKPNTNSYSSYTNCCNGGSIIDFVMEYYNLDLKDAINKCKDIAGIQRNGEYKQMNNNTRSQTNTKTKEQMQEEKKKQEEAERQRLDNLKQQKGQFINNALGIQTEENKQKVYEYLETRNISKEIADKYHLFISENVIEDHQHLERLVIPIYENGQPISYVARATSNDIQGQAKALNSAGEQKPLNIDYIKQKPTENTNTIYVCEGWADALSLEDTGEKAIALHSTQKANQFLELVNEYFKTASLYKYILCFDNDEAGQEATKKVSEKLTEWQVSHKKLNIPEEYKDVNEWYKQYATPEAFRNELNPQKDDNILRYIDNHFLNDIEKLQSYKSKSTGFKTLDEKINGIYPRTICTRCNK